MRVTFVLPGSANVPTGGARTVFRYANALAAAGWAVTIAMVPGLRSRGPVGTMLRRVRYCCLKCTRGYRPERWQTIHPAVRWRWLPDLVPARAVDGDAVVATAVQTAEAIARWPAAAGAKFYFVQGYETWDLAASRVQASWRLPLVKLAVSRWLCDLVAAAGATAVHLPNGVDEETFGLDRPPESRHKPIIVWPHHVAAQKGSPDVLRALAGLATEVPELEAHAFGLAAAPRAAALRVRYHRNPAQAALRALYNHATVAIAPSHSEGWGLPACEALQCGCALAASDIGGHREFLRHDGNALLHRPGDVLSLRANVLTLLRDESLRLRLARQGLADMAKLRFGAALERLQRILTGEAVL